MPSAESMPPTGALMQAKATDCGHPPLGPATMRRAESMPPTVALMQAKATDCGHPPGYKL